MEKMGGFILQAVPVARGMPPSLVALLGSKLVMLLHGSRPFGEPWSIQTLVLGDGRPPTFNS